MLCRLGDSAESTAGENRQAQNWMTDLENKRERTLAEQVRRPLARTVRALSLAGSFPHPSTHLPRVTPMRGRGRPVMGVPFLWPFAPY